MKTEKDNKLLETLETGNELALDSLEQDIIANTKRDKLYELLKRQHSVVHLDKDTLDKLRDITSQQPAPGHNTGVGADNGAPVAEQPQQQEQPSPDAKTDTGANTGADNESDRSKFEKQITPLLKRLFKPIETNLDKAGKKFVGTVQSGAQSAAGEVQDMLQLDQLPFYSTIKDTIKGVGSSALTAGKSLFERKKQSPDDKIAAILEKLSSPVPVPAPLTAGGDGSMFDRVKPDVKEKDKEQKQGSFFERITSGNKDSSKLQIMANKHLGEIEDAVEDIRGMKRMELAGKALMLAGMALPVLKVGSLIVGALTAVGALVIKYWEPIKEIFSSLWDWMKDVGGKAFDAISSLWKYFSDGTMTKDLGDAIKRIWDKATDVDTYIDAASSVADNIGNAVAEKVDQGREWLSEKTSGKSDTVLAGVSDASKFVREKRDQALGWMSEKTGIDLSDDANKSRIYNAYKSGGEMLNSAPGKIWDGMKTGFGNMFTKREPAPVTGQNKPSGSRAIEQFSAGRESDDDAVAIAQQAAEFRAEKHQLEQQQQMMAGAAKMVANTVVTNNSNVTNLMPSQTKWHAPDNDTPRHGAVR